MNISFSVILMNSLNDINSMEIPNGNVVIEFYSHRCKSCEIISKFLEEILKEFKDIKFIKVNVLENREVARSFGVIALPVIVALKDGVEVGRLKGAKTKREIESFLREVFGV